MTPNTTTPAPESLAPLNIREVAFVLDVKERQVNQAIDRDNLRVYRLRRRGPVPSKLPRTILLADLFAYALEERAATMVSFTKTGRATLHEALAGDVVQSAWRMVDSQIAALSNGTGRPGLLNATVEQVAGRMRQVLADIELTVGPLRLALGDMLGPLLPSVARVAASRGAVVSDPEVRGGEPVVSGTRIPVRMLADMRAQGVSGEVLLAEYPSLTADLLSEALLYAELHPRAGRPKRGVAPWRKDVLVFTLAAGARRVPPPAKKAASLQRASASSRPAAR